MKLGFAEPLQQVDRTYVLWRGAKYSYFGGCDYLRFSSHPSLLKSAQTALVGFGLNVAASRKTTGNHPLYEELEEQTAEFFNVRGVVLAPSAYLANIVAAQGLRGELDHVYIDACAHSSLRDALVFLHCAHTEFRHRDPADLRRKLALTRHRAGERIAILTDGMFAHDGSLAPLAAYRKLAGPGTLLWIDDAHGAGIFGQNGRGAVESEGISRRNVLQTITFSKAFGCYGGAILADRPTAERIAERSPGLAGSTPLPLPLAAAAIQAIALLRRVPSHRAKLWRNVDLFRAEARVPAETPRAPVFACCDSAPDKLTDALVRARIHPPFIRYPGGPCGGYFRFAISSQHTSAQIRTLAGVLAERLPCCEPAGR